MVQEGFDPAYGARPLRRASRLMKKMCSPHSQLEAITKWLEDSLAEHLLDAASEAKAPFLASLGPNEVAKEDDETEKRALVDLTEDGGVQVHRLPDAKKEKELTGA